MNILNIEHISKIYGEKVVFDQVSYGIHQGDKIGIVGINGTGKTTLLKMVAGIETPDEGEVIRQNGLSLSYLPQNPEFPKGGNILSYVTGEEKEEVWNAESEGKSILNRLGILEHNMSLDHLSGGQKKRVALAKTLLNPAHILILDEPTNHLDNEMVSWLEDYLMRYRGTILMVTHDRYFLDRVTNKILEISHGNLYGYTANYTEFLEMKANREEMEIASERKRQSVLRMELEWAKRGCRARSTKQKARLERLEILKNGGVQRDATVEMDSVATRMGKKTIELHHVGKSYAGKTLLEDFDYIVLKNQRLGIIGPNGCGKSTLMKIIAGEILPDCGEVELGETIKIGYFAQEEVDMNPEQRVIDYIKDVAEYIAMPEGRISASQQLERFLFDAAMQYTLIGKLSGGEKRRLYLLRILSQGNNVILLDEPTNNLDIPTLTILEDYLEFFQGIVITVSHDRYFLDNVVDRIFEFSQHGQLTQYEGGYTDYLEAKERVRCEAEKDCKTSENEKETGSKDWKENRPTKVKFSYKEQQEFATIDDDIAELEQAIELVEKHIMENATNSAKLFQLTEEKGEKEAELEAKMDRWVYLNNLAEEIEQQKK